MPLEKTEGEECGRNQSLRWERRVEPAEGKQPKRDGETTKEAVCHGAASSSHASGGAWLSQKVTVPSRDCKREKTDLAYGNSCCINVTAAILEGIGIMPVR
ncbi:hypothetical protein NDU88_002121 [Pleurodeles waltl]|uniref:Uncharacterized protein n=1 Tax=Pleurodeles waltl TaxID=8319 RepID=A0AAV7Q5T5_PLEWA|nr:hypothetical protein NDU88_002121 [Pleurodeles waltl]